MKKRKKKKRQIEEKKRQKRKKKKAIEAKRKGKGDKNHVTPLSKEPK